MPSFGHNRLSLIFALALLFGLAGCSPKKVPPADLITPDQDSAELVDPMHPGDFGLGEDPVSDSSGLTPQEEVTITGSGSSLGDPAIIKGVYSRLGKMEAENEFISEKLGKEGEDWKTKSVSVQNAGAKTCESVTVEVTKDQSVRIFYFDITEYSDSWE
ncbi:hypothetical protein J6U76_05745 [bacterium]|nr:hypothetical protein [bacterium]